MRNPVDRIFLLNAVMALFFLSLMCPLGALAACPGCCSSHGGISQSCATNGKIRCMDGTASPTCSCSSCGVSQPPSITYYTLTTSVSPISSGVITSSPAGINCGSDCYQSYASGTAVTLTASPAMTSTVNWSGACSGSSLQCQLTMYSSKSVSVTFSPVVAPPEMTLRDAIYLYGQALNGKGDKVLVGVDCDVFQLVTDVTSGFTNLAMGQGSTLANAISTRTAYPDKINSTDAMFAYALYQDQPVKAFVFNDKEASSTQTGTVTAFGYCYSTKPTGHVYFQQKDTCINTYSDGLTTSCLLVDIGSK